MLTCLKWVKNFKRCQVKGLVQKTTFALTSIILIQAIAIYTLIKTGQVNLKVSEILLWNTCLPIRIIISILKISTGHAWTKYLSKLIYYDLMLLIDCHEPNKIINKLKVNIHVEILRLKYGDYLFSDILLRSKIKD